MPHDKTFVLERGLMEWVAEYAMTRLLKTVPPEQRGALAQQARDELGVLLCTAPIEGDPVAEIIARAEIAAAFGVASFGR